MAFILNFTSTIDSLFMPRLSGYENFWHWFANNNFEIFVWRYISFLYIYGNMKFITRCVYLPAIFQSHIDPAAVGD